jgi:CHAT domain-containing protein
VLALRFVPRVALCLAPLILLALSSWAAAQTAFTEVDRSAVRLSKARLQDSDTILGFAAEGAALYAAEPIKLTGYQYCSQAVSLAEAGEFRQSLRAASKALHLAVDGKNDDLLALAKRDLAIVMSYSGDLDKAELFARQSLTHTAKDPQVVVGPAWKTIGDVQARRHDHAAAIASYERAAAASSERFKPLVMGSLANALLDSGDIKRARSVLDGVALFDNNPALRAQLDRSQARLLLAEGRTPEALAAYQTLAARNAGFDSPYHRLWALEGVANAQLALGNKRAAADAMIQALDSLDTVRAQFRSEEIKLGLFSDLQALFERAIGLSLDLGDASRALDISEKSRARAFLDAVRGRAPVAQAALSTVNASAVQALLAPDERLLQFHSLSDRLAVWVVSRDAVRATTIPLGRSALAVAVDELRQSITEGRGAAIGLADKLGAQMIGPLGLAGSERLIVVPHGPLHYLPFQALRLNGSYLIERHRIASVPSMSIAAQLVARKSSTPAQVVAFGNPKIEARYDLPGADLEVSQLVKVFKGATSYMGANATKTRFTQAAPEARVLHVAAHAEADLVDPLRSRILLANEDGRQNFLDASEVLALDLSKVKLVTLSACESALGRIASGDEVLGFPRSFLSAGADSMIASLWPVADDATSLLMNTVYTRLGQGADLQSAMQSGQLAVLKNPKLSHPFFWAPFNLIGNWRLTLEQ